MALVGDSQHPVSVAVVKHLGSKTQPFSTIVAEFRSDGINAHLASGDHSGAVQAVAVAVGIERANIEAQRKPDEKQAYVAGDVTRGTADVVLLSELGGIPFLIGVSRAAAARVALNFLWSAVYNVFAILLATGAFVRARIAPAYAGAGKLVSILRIIVASLTMLLLNYARTECCPLHRCACGLLAGDCGRQLQALVD
ncbi:hypothetical protein F4802DRAFT_602072 [Xylaria palmicola]|nr:hypothetical protein F4802DRAFT_602072 [Xylaria palmicola]